MARRRTKRAAEISTGTIIVLGLGAVVAGVAIYEWRKNATPATPAPTTGAPAQLTPTATGVTAAVAPPA